MDCAYTTLAVSRVTDHVVHVEINRPDKLNTMNIEFWAEVREFFERIESDEECRCIILSGAGRMFTAGLDMTAGTPTGGGGGDKDVARVALSIRRTGLSWQQSFNSIEQCGKPVIACVHNACIGGGIEMISACDVRFATSDAWFKAAEVNIGMAADVGGLQRFPKVIGNQSLVRELCLSGRKFTSQEAMSHGFLSRVCDNKEAMLAEAVALAQEISSKSPVATLGIKHLLNHARDHTVAEALDYAITWNTAMLQTKDMLMAGAAILTKEAVVFPNLPKVPEGPAKSKL
jgi:delta(3,5)-delta(2,4)-dienoyl-CoA isomerase